MKSPIKVFLASIGGLIALLDLIQQLNNAITFLKGIIFIANMVDNVYQSYIGYENWQTNVISQITSHIPFWPFPDLVWTIAHDILLILLLYLFVTIIIDNA